MSLDQPLVHVKAQNVTFDAFLGGLLTIAQMQKGFRAGLDSVLLGAAVRAGTTSVLDMGAGTGVAGLCALAHNSTATALLAEVDAGHAELAALNVRSNAMDGRCAVATIDITAPGPRRREAGLVPDSFSSVIANPPFFDAKGGTPAPESRRARARAMPAETLDKWVRTAAGAAAPKGEVIFIHRASAMPELLAAFSARLGAVTVLPIVPRPGEAASRILVRGIKGSRAPLQLLSPLVLHGANGNHFAPLPAAILNGTARLHW